MILCAHSPDWAEAFAREAASLRAALIPLGPDIYHVGSTAVPDLIAKPVIDIALTVDAVSALDTFAAALENLGYQPKGENGIAGRRYFVKRKADGTRSHHLHAFGRNAPQVRDHLVFRDSLRSHPSLAEQYAGLKRAIVAEGGTTRADYEAAKADFIARTIALECC